MKWYQEKTFKIMFFGVLGLTVLSVIGTSIVDGELNLQATYVFLPVLTIGTLITYLKRDKK